MSRPPTSPTISTKIGFREKNGGPANTGPRQERWCHHLPRTSPENARAVNAEQLRHIPLHEEEEGILLRCVCVIRPALHTPRWHRVVNISCGTGLRLDIEPLQIKTIIARSLFGLIVISGATLRFPAVEESIPACLCPKDRHITFLEEILLRVSGG